MEASANVPLSHSQEFLGSKQDASLAIPATAASDSYATLTSVVADNYDKQELNIIFDSLLTGPFPDPSTEVNLKELAFEIPIFPVSFI